MRLVRSVFSNGERLPFLYRDVPAQPVLVPFLYVVLKLRHQAFNTIQSSLRSIQAFYEYHESLGFEDVDEQIIHAQFDTLLTSLDGFAIWITNGRLADNVVARIGLDDGNANLIAPNTRDAYLRSLKQYLQWCAQRYMSSRRSTDPHIEQKFIDLHNVIEKRFQSHLLKVKNPKADFRSLTDEQLDAVRAVINPTSDLNPFRPQFRRRNQIIIELFLETGLRRGELLKLQPSDVVRTPSGNAYLSVTNREDDPHDTRADEPALKTQQRTISLSPALYNAITRYIDKERRPVRHGKPMKLKHTYLFVSERGLPLSTTGCDYIIKAILAVVQQSYPNTINDLSAHDFRHTFATRFLEYLVEGKNIRFEDAKDELRRICGWSMISQMPQLYGQRYISQSANQHNLERAQAAWDRLTGVVNV